MGTKLWHRKSGKVVVAFLPVALVFFAVSILYLRVTHENVVKAEIAKLETRALITSAVLGEGSTGTKINGAQFILPSIAMGIIKRVASSPDERTLIFDSRGKKIADSKFVGAHAVEILPLSQQIADREDNSSSNFISLFSFWLADGKVPTYSTSEEAKALFDLTKLAVSGEAKSSFWRGDDGELIIVAAAPIQRFKQVPGVVLIRSSQNEIERNLQNLFLNFLGIFGLGAIFGITSLFFWRRISA